MGKAEIKRSIPETLFLTSHFSLLASQWQNGVMVERRNNGGVVTHPVSDVIFYRSNKCSYSNHSHMSLMLSSRWR